MNVSRETALVLKEIKDRRMDTSNAFSFLRELIKKVRSRNKKEDAVDITMGVLRQVAMGLDGIPGTSDDIFPQETLLDLQKMVDTTICQDLVDLIIRGNKKNRWLKLMLCISKTC